MDSTALGAYCVVFKDTTEGNQVFCYKLWMLGIEVEVVTYVLFEENSVCVNSSIPEYTHREKHNFIAYHAVYWASSDKKLRV